MQNAQVGSFGTSLEYKQEGSIISSAETLAPVEPKPITYDACFVIVNNTSQTLHDDPLTRFLIETEDRRDNALTRAVEKFVQYSHMSQYVPNKTGWTIDGGDASVCYTDPSIPPPRSSKVFEYVAGLLIKFLRSKQQGNRLKQVQQKLRPALQEFFESRGKDWFTVDHISTISAKQGRGYGTTLCKLVTAKADACSKPTFLISSNVKANTTFYNNLGFFRTKEIVFGDDDPTWKEPPFTIEIMVREVSLVDTVDEKLAMQEYLDV